MSLPSLERAPGYRVGDVIAGKYRLDALLGQGGMGAVWQAFNLTLEAPVALKVLLRDNGDQTILTQRLKQEAKVAAMLGHPAIVRVFDVGESEAGDAFIVMELLRGRSLAAILTEEVCLSGERAVRLLLPIADALAAAHAKGIIHRDLKPDNVFIVDDDERTQPKLVDFGIVKLTEAATHRTSLTQVGTVLGSPEYMSPEQARGLDDIDHRSDVWSFCVLLYELVSGVTPFGAANYNALLRSIVENEPRPIEPRSAEEAELWQIILLGLAKDRDQRPRSMTELGRALAAWLLRQGVTDDVCGASLEAKWVLRSSDAGALAAVSRGSLPSFPGLPPASGVRPAGELASAATVEANATDTGSAEAPAAEVIEVAMPRRRRGRSVLLALGSALVASTLVTLGLLSQKTEPASSATELPVLTPSVAQATGVEAPPTVQVPPGAVDGPVHANGAPAATPLNQTAAAATTAGAATTAAAATTATEPPRARPASVRARRAEAKTRSSADQDLISPY